ncbi:MAG: ABC transporter ATPase [Polaribacter sp.]|uniref:ABC transporter ATPase n=1 Tax=Polaribacter sp. TaxID=1920175 RepID=UPI003BAF336D
MFIKSIEISEDAKVWIYPSSRKFYPTETKEIEEKLKYFIDSWKIDDENFKASYQFLYDRFIIFMADDEKSTLKNTDIDASVSFILELQETYKVALLDRMNICFKQGEFVQYKELTDLKSLIKNRAVTAKTIVFDNLISAKKDLEEFWEIPLEESWYNRFL